MARANHNLCMLCDSSPCECLKSTKKVVPKTKIEPVAKTVKERQIPVLAVQPAKQAGALDSMKTASVIDVDTDAVLVQAVLLLFRKGLITEDGNPGLSSIIDLSREQLLLERKTAWRTRDSAS